MMYFTVGLSQSRIIFSALESSLIAVQPGSVAQSVTCLATDASLASDPGVASSIHLWRLIMK